MPSLHRVVLYFSPLPRCRWCVRDTRARVRASTNRSSFVYYRVKRFVETLNSHLFPVFIIATRSTRRSQYKPLHFNRDNPERNRIEQTFVSIKKEKKEKKRWRMQQRRWNGMKRRENQRLLCRRGKPAINQALRKRTIEYPFYIALFLPNSIVYILSFPDNGWG